MAVRGTYGLAAIGHRVKTPARRFPLSNARPRQRRWWWVWEFCCLRSTR